MTVKILIASYNPLSTQIIYCHNTLVASQFTRISNSERISCIFFSGLITVDPLYKRIIF